MDVVLGAGAALNADSLVSLDGGGLTVGGTSALSLASLNTLTNSSLSLDGAGSLTTGTLVDIDNSTLAVSGGASFGSQVTDAQYATNRGAGNLTLLSSSGPGSVLDLSSVQSFQFSETNNNSFTQRVTADGGAINLSGMQSITTGAAQTSDVLAFEVRSGGSIDLSSLQTIDTDNRTRFDIGAGQTQDLAALTTARNMDVVLGAGAALNADNLASLDSGAVDVTSGTSASFGSLSSVVNSTITADGAGLTVGSITNADNSTFDLRGGAVLNDLADQNYSSAGLAGTRTLLSADGSATVINASGVESIDAGFNDNNGSVRTHTIAAMNSGEVDLTGLRTIATPARAEDRIDFVAQTNGVIRFGEVEAISGAGEARFRATDGGRLAFENLALTDRMNISAETVTSGVSVSGTLDVRGGTLNMAPGSTLDLGDQYLLSITDETALSLTDNIVRFAEGGTRNNPSFLEVGGLDVGAMDPGNSGNFGFGQLVLGTDATSSVVALTDLFDNGNRGGMGEAESLYLFGFGGPDGLVLNSGSTLIIGNINTFLLFDGAWLHLNSLFGPGVTEIPFSEGFVVIPAPSTAGILALAAVGAVRRRRNH